MRLPIDIGMLRELMRAAAAPLPGDAADYRISTAIGSAFLGRGRSGRITLLVPLTAAVGAVGRSGGGFTLTSAPRVVFDHESRRWEQPAAILECTDERLGDAFLVLVMDIAQRLPENSSRINWQTVLACVEEWQALLSRRSILSPEEQLGLWGELWVICQAAHADSIAAAWRGPSGEPIDFFHDGIALEVKVSRRAHVHHVSQSQLEAPRGEHESYLLSLWVGTEPVRGVSLGELAEQLLIRVSDPAAFLKQLARAGYSPQDHREYTEGYVPLEPASWFRTCDVPRVRAFDEGITKLRYVVTLDMGKCLDEARMLDLWRHFGHADSAETREHGD
jgi:hypothetical protein